MPNITSHQRNANANQSELCLHKHQNGKKFLKSNKSKREQGSEAKGTLLDWWLESQITQAPWKAA